MRGRAAEHADEERLEPAVPESGRRGDDRRRPRERWIQDLQRAYGQVAGWPERVRRLLWRRQSAAAEAAEIEGSRSVKRRLAGSLLAALALASVFGPPV